MKSEARSLLAGEARAPVMIDEAAATSLLRVARAAGARVAELRAPESKAALLDAIGTGLRYPDPWGRDWGALAEMLRLPEPVGLDGEPTRFSAPDAIVWRDPAVLAEADPEAWSAVGEILRAAITDRRERGAAPLVVALTGALPAEPAASPEAAADPGAACGDPAGAGGSGDAVGDDAMPGSAGAVAAVPGSAGPAATDALHGVPPSVRRIGRVHHVAVVVRDLDAALRFWRDTLGLAPGPVVPIASDRVNIAFLPVGDVKIELVEPTDDSTGVARFLADRGEGFHHVCFEVPDIHLALTRLALDGIELIDSLPRPGAEGPVAFLHPRSCHGVLVELIEKEGGPAWAAFYPAGFRAPGT